jgi:hypothetical protein
MRSMVEGPSEPQSPSTALRAVPLPMSWAHGEDWPGLPLASSHNVKEPTEPLTTRHEEQYRNGKGRISYRCIHFGSC